MATPSNPDRPANRLAGSASPYLLQHAHNPVDWYPWGEDALARARELDRPIFLSVGYAACHWCHVMERESFENPSVAAILNRHFVSIKVDREERPDIDEIYMAATQLMTQSGGWPMSVFLDTEGRPFFAGTYFPPEDRWGRPGFKSLLGEIHKAWTERRGQVEEQASRVLDGVQQALAGGVGQGALQPTLLTHAEEEILTGYDAEHGGFGRAPKFPPSMRLEFLLRRAGRSNRPQLLHAVGHTLERMARGGMYDHIGGGFHRYSVDERWLVPHFEKMLYDNALLARIYAIGYEAFGLELFARVAGETLDYVRREMTHPEGGFYSTTDADSEGVEGKFFVWSPEEIGRVLSEEDARLFCEVYDVTSRGNFEGRSIPNLLAASVGEQAERRGIPEGELQERLTRIRARLWRAREERVHPLLDDKILANWNGLMIRAFCEGYRVFTDLIYLETAEKAANFVWERMRVDGVLRRSWRNGEARFNAYQEDYAALALAFLELHLVGQEPRWLDAGLTLLQEMHDRFWDDLTGGYYFTSHDHETLVARPRSSQDGAAPSGSSLAALALLRALQITGDERHKARLERLLMSQAPQLAQHPAAFPNMLVAADGYLDLFPEGISIPGAGAVRVEALVSRSRVRPGNRFWAAIRVKVAPGYHLNSHRPYQVDLMPTELVMEPSAAFTVVSESYPEGRNLNVGFLSEPISVYEGDVLIGLEVEVSRRAGEGRHPMHVVARLQPCSETECLAPMEARVRLRIEVGPEDGEEQNPEVFDTIRSR